MIFLPSVRNLSVSFLVFALLAVAGILLNHSALAGSWRWDDPSILLHIHTNSFIGDFLEPEVWQSFSPANLTPWLTFSYEIDLILFGLSPAFFYGHQLIALSAAAFSLFFLLSLWTRKVFALFGAALFLCGTPSFLIAQQLMTRHYVEGLVFCLFSLICFVMYLRQRRASLLIISTLLYVLAATAKETYVPLVLLLPLMPESNWKTRLFAALPHVCIALLYTAWRSYMLENLGGGYIGASDYLSFGSISNVASTFLTFPALLFGDYWFVAVFLYLFLFAATAITNRAVLRHFFLVGFLVCTPLVPLVSFPGITIADRYLLLPWVAICFSVAWFCDRLSQNLIRDRGAGITIWCSPILVLALASVVAGKQTLASVLVIANSYDKQGEFIWQNNEEQIYQPSPELLASYWYVTDLSTFKSRLIENSSSPQPVVDYYFEQPTSTRPWVYQSACNCLEQENYSVADAVSLSRDKADQNAELSMEYQYNNSYFTWRFGPYDSGQFHIVSTDLGLVPAPPAGRLRVSLDECTSFFLRYTSPEGWTTYSEEQRISISSQTTTWERESR